MGPNPGTVQALSLFNLLLPKLERMRMNRKRNSGLHRENPIAFGQPFRNYFVLGNWQG